MLVLGASVDYRFLLIFYALVLLKSYSLSTCFKLGHHHRVAMSQSGSEKVASVLYRDIRFSSWQSNAPALCNFPAPTRTMASPDEIIACFVALKIPKTHATVGVSNVIASNKQFFSLFANRRLPDHGWTDVQIQQLLFLLSTLDTNKKLPACMCNDDMTESRWAGVGEREGRVYSSLVAQRHYGFSHGMGRSGDITEPQPKAVGSSVLVKLALMLTLDALRRGSGLNAKTAAAHGILLPLCTGMSMSLVLSSLRDEENPHRNLVLWSRIDQKSCLKAVQSAGLTCIVVPTLLDGDRVVTDVSTMEQLLGEHTGKVLAVITTTSCFAPRVPDKVDRVAQLCASHGIYHISIMPTASSVRRQANLSIVLVYLAELMPLFHQQIRTFLFQSVCTPDEP
jgi:hypothetical protein